MNNAHRVALATWVYIVSAGCGSEVAEPDTRVDTSAEATETDTLVAETNVIETVAEDTEVFEDVAPEDVEVEVDEDIEVEVFEDVEVEDAALEVEDAAPEAEVDETIAPTDVSTSVSEDAPIIVVECVAASDCPRPETCRVARCVDHRCEVALADELAPCSDDNVCSTGDVCVAGACQAVGVRDCDDDNACTFDGCNRVSGCVNVALPLACSDGDACTVGDLCSDGHCTPGAATTCDDGNACTDDRCDPALGCVFAPHDRACDDGDACTLDDVCDDGQCRGAPRSCAADDDPCTDAACDAALGCVVLFNQAPCDDGDACSEDDACVAGQCVGGAERRCSDGETCTLDACNPASGCSYEPRVVPCDDGSACTTDDMCDGGVCQPGAARDCDDGEACTSDRCDEALGCVSTTLVGACDSGHPCFAGQCVDGACVTTPRLWSWNEERAGEQTADDVVALDDGSVVFVGGENARAVRLAGGEVVWEVALGFGFFTSAARVDDTIAFGGGRYDPENHFDAIIVRVDAAGQVVATDTIARPGSQSITVMATSGDDLIAVGDDYADGARGWLWRVDPDGALVWDRALEESFSPYGITATADGGALVAGYDPALRAFVMRLAPDGSVAWSQVHGGSGDDAWVTASERADGRLVLGGYTIGEGGYDFSWGVAEADGTLVFMEGFATPDYDYPWRGRAYADGGVALVGYSTAEGGSFAAMRVDARGQVVFLSTFGQPSSDDESGWGVAPLADGGMAVVGYGYGTTSYEASAYRVDAWGHTDCVAAGLCAGVSASACGGAACEVGACEPELGCAPRPVEGCEEVP